MGLVRNKPFMKTIYLAYGGTGDGQSADAAAPFVTGDLYSFPAGTVVEGVDVYIDTAITGTTAWLLGDDDDNDGYAPDLAAALGTPGLYNSNAKVAGAYLRVQTAGVTDAADIYVVPAKKYYSAVGKELKQVCTTANTAGAARVVVYGKMLTK